MAQAPAKIKARSDQRTTMERDGARRRGRPIEGPHRPLERRASVRLPGRISATVTENPFWHRRHHSSGKGRDKSAMPLYLDVHHKIDGLTSSGVEDAHKKDLEVQKKYGVNYLRYWYDEGTGKVFCLVQAPTKEAAAAVHREAHGMVADEIIEVKEGS